ncbi:hypothetical protein G3N28_13145 [Desulfobacter hydrogenophilus]|nr:hypothetical protein [Desulfobacter hydrogenophilus]NDY72978.1 hypothetical protein [Desulfobacter hydrogenophilus]
MTITNRQDTLGQVQGVMLDMGDDSPDKDFEKKLDKIDVRSPSNCLTL